MSQEWSPPNTERISIEEAAIIKKMATDRLKDQLIKADYSADEVNTWDRDRLLAMVAEEKSRVSVQRQKMQRL